MPCPRCQQDNPPHARFCLGCGARLALVCGSCGAELPGAARFCLQCAQPVDAGSAAPVRSPAPETYTPKHLAEKILTSKAALEGERKQVTVLFADLKGSMELLADRDPEQARKLLDPVLEHMMEAVHRYEGTVNQVMGDGIMALFGAPLAHEDHAVRACYAALRMQESVKRYAEGARRTEGVLIQIRVGLNSGEVVVRAIGSDLHMDYTAVGQTTHLAARMEQLTPPGAILLTTETLRLAEGYVQVKPLGPTAVKGLSEPVQTYELTGVSAVRSRLQAAAARGFSRFVGRETEIEQLRRALEQARQGRGQVAAIVGEPGVGKSRLCWEFLRSTNLTDSTIAEAAAAPYGKSTSYGIVADIMKSLLGIDSRDEARRIRDKVVSKLLSLDGSFEGLATPLLWLLDVPVEDARWEQVDPADRRRRALDGVRRILARTAQRQPVLVLLEDLHWVDVESQLVLDSLVDGLAASRVLLIVTYRPAYQHTWAAKSYYRQIRLGSLGHRDAGELLDSLVGRAPSLTELKRLLGDRTEGNPFFLEETVRTLVETGALVGQPGAYSLRAARTAIQVPASVHAVIASRVDRLPGASKRVLQAASVIGKDIPHSLLRVLVEDDDEALRAALAGLQRAELLYESTLFPEQEYTFTHALTHEVVYGTLLHERRRALHTRAAAAIELLYADRLSEHVEKLADHAVQGELWERAVDFLTQAGKKAFSRSTHALAAQWFEQAIQALDRLPRTSARLEQAIDLRLELRYALTPIGQLTRILQVLKEAERLALEAGDERRLGLVHSFLTNYFQVTGNLESAILHGEAALGLSEKGQDVATEVVAAAFLSATFFILGEYRRSVELAYRSTARLRGDTVTQRFGMAPLPAVYSRTALVRSLAELGDFTEGMAQGEEAVAIAEAVDHPVSLSVAYFGRGYLFWRQGDIAQALASLERAANVSRAANVIWFRQIASTLASAYASAARVTEAYSALQEAGHLSIEPTGYQLGHGVWLIATGEVHLAAGRLDDAARGAEEAVRYFSSINARGYRAWALRLLGAAHALPNQPAVERAEARYLEATGLARSLGMQPLTARCHVELGTLYQRAGMLDRATAQLHAAIRILDTLDMAALNLKAREALAALEER